METGLYLGIMSGTSMDGIDAALVEFSKDSLNLIATHNISWPQNLKKELKSIALPGENEIERLGTLDIYVADHFARAVNELLEQADIKPKQVTAIGSHGQTIRHKPETKTPFTLQIGDPNRIAELTGITTIADFRRRDMAAGGQGAPLACAFHQEIFGSKDENRAVLNIGGIANLTLLSTNPDSRTTGFDTGPANTLLDAWASRHLNRVYDSNGDWAASGRVVPALLDEMLNEKYLQLPPPKSTGPELFNLAWLDKLLVRLPDLEPQDIQATLASFTAKTIAGALSEYAPDCNRVIACGGGVHNQDLIKRLRKELDVPLDISTDHGLNPDHVEAVAFAWLARQTLLGLPGNLPEVTGAKGPRILGGIYAGLS